MINVPELRNELILETKMLTCGTITPQDTNYIFKWVIPSFLERPECNGQCLYSPEFSVCDLNNRSGACSMSVYPRGENESSRDFLSIFLHNRSDSVLTLSYVITLEDKVGIKRAEVPIKSTKFDINQNWGISKFFKRDEVKKEINNLLHSDNITLKVEFRKPGPKSALSVLSDDLQISFSDKAFSDLQILCKEERFYVHRVILASRSQVFKKMLSTQTKESINREIILDSMESIVIKEMLLFIYSGKMNDLEGNAVNLLKAADRYQIDNLKDICGHHLSSRLDLENCLDYLTLGDVHNQQHLKDTAMAYVLEKIKTLMKTPKWKELKTNYPILMMEVMEDVVEKRVI